MKQGESLTKIKNGFVVIFCGCFFHFIIFITKQQRLYSSLVILFSLLPILSNFRPSQLSIVKLLSISFIVNFTASLIEGVIETELYVKPTNSHQYLQSSSCHAFHCKKGMTYTQGLRLNCICLETVFLNTVMIWKDFPWKEDTVLQKEILRARKIPRNELLDKEKDQGIDSKLTFNVTFYQVPIHLKSLLK